MREEIGVKDKKYALHEIMQMEEELLTSSTPRSAKSRLPRGLIARCK